ncbi:hypothetical protein C1637_21420 [Chryseobacterium lactis]|uniref:DUF3667 domain-containing protein n=1 Tax=Chryseobacterium lactis TaxID=1241981 RepID=A0A3G6RG44_CHRLC|nr:DUF3667 domain-containing protein [Chryseobacterium lactis]AZA83370.1 DUF3667 domain-containing protein [Chryseobacterium lactis]AZB03755.1 DUF3667 domain-containing protein [Chryseobacterium lactis]PNW11669.1 hypothetical protein C1637_21420 [Chryseobacterium lactis]
MQSTCLNCSHTLTAEYCGKCGQKASTHRYSLRHFIEHDFIHGVWHVDKGALFTVKELFTRPGNSVREYILGKRAKYFSFITLLILTASISAIVSHYFPIDFKALVPQNGRDSINSFEKLMTSYPKIVLLISIPVNSIFSYLWFRKAGFNYSEHLVLNSYKTAAEILVGLIFTVITLFSDHAAVVASLYLLCVFMVSILYGTWFYAQFFSQSGYSKGSLLFRSIMIPVSYLFCTMIIGFLWGIFSVLLR